MSHTLTPGRALALSPERQRRRQQYRNRLKDWKGQVSPPAAQTLFCEIVEPQLGVRQKLWGIIRAIDLPHTTREQLEDLYEVLAERCETRCLYAAWDALEKELWDPAVIRYIDGRPCRKEVVRD